MLSVEEDGHMRDVTPRYATNWLSTAHKERIDVSLSRSISFLKVYLHTAQSSSKAEWWQRTLEPMETLRGCQVESQEKMAVEQKHISQELPKILIAYISHVPIFFHTQHIQ